MMTNRGDDGAEEGLAGEIGLVEHPPVRDPFVNRKRILTISSTSRRHSHVETNHELKKFENG